MPTERLLDILALMAHRAPPPDGGSRSLCTVAAQVTGVSGAGIGLTSAGEHVTSLCTSDATAQVLMDLEMTTGEGPCVETCASGRSIAQPDLSARGGSTWLAYGPSALAAGARAVFALPVQIGEIRFGALSLFCDQPGMLSDAQFSDAHLMASVVARAVLTLQAGTPPGALLDELSAGASFDFTVHQAAGMVAVQGSISLRNAQAALRAHAYTLNVSASALAARIVGRDVAFVAGAWRERGLLDADEH